MQHQQGRLIDRLHRNKSHRRPCYRLRDRFCIRRVGLAALDIGLHVGRRHKLHGMAERTNLARPVVSGGAGFHADKTRRKAREQRNDIGPPHLSANDHLAIGSHAVDLKNVLRQIQTDRCNLCHGILLYCRLLDRDIIARLEQEPSTPSMFGAYSQTEFVHYVVKSFPTLAP
jgi:hypothetical protein